ncbi:MAG TPA: hypothetical protein VFL17_20410 [Anaerolineae bacterium]|nr:hypothetical protein [Anaerolineae bacterium]
MAGLDYPVFPLDLSPDGRWLMVAFEIEYSTGRAAMAVIDTQGESHWWMNTQANFFSPYFVTYPYLYPSLYPRWLPDGRLLWVNQVCKVFVWDGQNRRELSAPEPVHPVYWVVYASKGIAFANTWDGGLWRVDLASERWEEVTTHRPPRLGRLGNAILAFNGSYALAFQTDQSAAQMWRIPAEMGSFAEPLPDIQDWVDVPGHGGPSGPPSTHLADTPYWLLNVGIALVVNERDGSIITAKDLHLPEGYYIIDYYASPDGRWLAVTITDDRQQPWEQPDMYIAPSTDLTAGRIVEGVSVAGWHIDAPAVILRDQATGALSVARLPLADATPRAPLDNAMSPLVTLPNMVFAVDAASPARLLQFDLDGNLLSTLDLSSQYDLIRTGTGTAGRVFLGVTRSQDGSHALVEWAVGP